MAAGGKNGERERERAFYIDFFFFSKKSSPTSAFFQFASYANSSLFPPRTVIGQTVFFWGGHHGDGLRSSGAGVRGQGSGAGAFRLDHQQLL